jgi:hypothetical protein
MSYEQWQNGTVAGAAYTRARALGSASAIKHLVKKRLAPDRAKPTRFAAPCVPPRMFSCSCRSARKLIEKMHALDEGAQGAKSTYRYRIANELVAAAFFRKSRYQTPGWAMGLAYSQNARSRATKVFWQFGQNIVVDAPRC